MSDAVVNGLAGAGGGIVAQLLTYPLQAVNTRQQTERNAKKEVTRDGAVWSADRSQRKSQGTVNELWKVVRQEGWGGLYRGLSPSLIGTACSQGVYYYFYQLLKNEAEARSIKRKNRGSGDGTVGMLGSLVVAALAGCVNVLLTNPIWVIVTRMQTQNQAQRRAKTVGKSGSTSPNPDPAQANTEGPPPRPVSQGAIATVRELYDEAGPIGFWKGVLPTLIMVSNPAMQFMIYETLLKWLTKKRPVQKNGLKHTTAQEIFALSAVAKLGATVVTYPLLVVKSRLQAKQDIGEDKAHQYTGTVDAIVKMIRHEGLFGFYKGMSTKIVQSVVAAAVLFMIKEELVKGARALVTKREHLAKAVRLVDTK